MTGGLREYWELPEINRPEGANGNGDFSQDFRAGLAGVNQDMQVVTARGGQGDRQKLDANRQTLIAAYQNVAPLGDAAKNGQVMGAVAKVREQTSAKATAINAGYEEWQKREAAFDAAVVKIGELENADHPKAPAYRKLSEAIQTRANSGDFQNANTAFDQLQPKLEDLVKQPDGPTPVLDGLDSGPVRADVKEKIYDDAKKKVFGQGVTTIIIKNFTSKMLRKVNAEHGKDVVWLKEPPTQIAAAKSANDPTTVTIRLETDKLYLGATRGNTSGFATYEVDGTDKKRKVSGKSEEKEEWYRDKVFVRWVRKGTGEVRSEKISAEGAHDIVGDQSEKGEITFEIREIAKPAKPVAPPADIFVLFAHNKPDLTSVARSELDGFLAAYRAAKSTAKINVEGWASIDGKEKENKELSSKRAEAVMNYLVAGGIPKDNVPWTGKGVTSDFDPTNLKNLEPNRCVTIKVK